MMTSDSDMQLQHPMMLVHQAAQEGLDTIKQVQQLQHQRFLSLTGL